MKKVLWIVIGLIIAVCSPFIMYFYIQAITNFIPIDSSDLWSFSGAVITALIAGGFILYQLEYEKKQQEKDFKVQNRADIEFSYVRADISDENGYLYGEDFYVNNLKRHSKYDQLKKTYFQDGLIPPTFKIECYNKVATKIEIYYEYSSAKGNTYTQKIDAGNLAEGQSKYFITSNIMQHVCNPKKYILNKYEALVADVEYFPKNIINNIIYVTFRTLSYERGVIMYKFDLSEVNKEDTHHDMIIEDILIQEYEVYYENDLNFPHQLFDKLGKFKYEKPLNKSRLVKLNKRII